MTERKKLSPISNAKKVYDVFVSGGLFEVADAYPIVGRRRNGGGGWSQGAKDAARRAVYELVEHGYAKRVEMADGRRTPMVFKIIP